MGSIAEACAAVQARVDELLTETGGTPPALDGLDDEARLVALVVFEHDLREAMGRPGGRVAPEVRTALTLQLEALKPALKRARARVLLVETEGGRWASHVGRRGCTLRIDPWLATRVLAGRLTADEVRALPHRGDVEPVLRALGLA
jgi:hypothetical protein